MALILLIDDDGFYRGLIERALTDEGHNVVAVQSAVAGIASYQDRRPDLTITDMRMPSVGGAEVIRAIYVGRSGESGALSMAELLDVPASCSFLLTKSYWGRHGGALFESPNDCIP